MQNKYMWLTYSGSSSSLSSSVVALSDPLEHNPQHTPQADTHDMPALMQLHFIV